MFLGLSIESWIAIASVAGPALLHIFGKINIPGLPPANPAPSVQPVAPAAPNGVFPILPNGPLAGHPIVDRILNAALDQLLLQVSGANPSGNPPVKV